MPLEDKTEAPTPRRRQEARQEGQVARSVELNSALVLLTCLVIVRMTGPALVERLREVALNSLTHFPSRDLTIPCVSAQEAQSICLSEYHTWVTVGRAVGRGLFHSRESLPLSSSLAPVLPPRRQPPRTCAREGGRGKQRA